MSGGGGEVSTTPPDTPRKGLGTRDTHYSGQTDRQTDRRSCGKVMFLHLSVILFTGGSLSRWSLSGGSLFRVVSVRGVSVRGGLGQEDPIPTAVRLRAGGTHPTGMHSCLSKSLAWKEYLYLPFCNFTYPQKIKSKNLPSLTMTLRLKCHVYEKLPA